MFASNMCVAIKRVRVIHEVDNVTKKITKVIVVLNTPNGELIHTTDTSKMTWLEAECTAKKLANDALALYQNNKVA